MAITHRILCTTILALAGLLCACKSDTVQPVTVEATFSSIQKNVFSKNCTTSSCHSTLSQRGGLILEESVAYSNLTGVASQNTSAQGQGLLRVNPGKPDSSFILIKLTGPGNGQGGIMPFNNGTLDQQTISAIRTWIANGAKQN